MRRGDDRRFDRSEQGIVREGVGDACGGGSIDHPCRGSEALLANWPEPIRPDTNDRIACGQPDAADPLAPEILDLEDPAGFLVVVAPRPVAWTHASFQTGSSSRW